MAKAAHLILVINVSDLIALSLDFLGAHAHSHPNPEWVFAGQALGGPKIPKKETFKRTLRDDHNNCWSCPFAAISRRHNSQKTPLQIPVTYLGLAQPTES